MKKNIFNIIISGLVILTMSGCGKTEETPKVNNKKEETPKEATTMTEFVEAHSTEILHCAGCNEMSFAYEDFKCDALKDNEPIYFDDLIMILDNKKVYQITLNGLYSNNQNCKEIKTDIEFDDVKYYNRIYLIKKNDFYQINIRDNEYTIEKSKENHAKLYYQYNYDHYQNSLAKKGNKLYKIDYYINEEKQKNELKNPKERYDFNEYGNVKLLWTNYDVEEPAIEALLTDKGLYYEKLIETDECKKYVDVECEKKFVESEVYKKFKKDIKVMGTDYTLLNDNKIISSYYFFRALDE